MHALLFILISLFATMPHIAQAQEDGVTPERFADAFSQKFKGKIICLALVNQDVKKSDSPRRVLTAPRITRSDCSAEDFIKSVVAVDDKASAYLSSDGKVWLLELNFAKDVPSPLSSTLKLPHARSRSADPIGDLSNVGGGIFIPHTAHPDQNFFLLNGETVRQTLMRIAASRQTGWVFQTYREEFVDSVGQLSEGLGDNNQVLLRKSTTSIKFLTQLPVAPSGKKAPTHEGDPLTRFILNNSPGKEFKIIGGGTYSPISLSPSLAPIYILVFAKMVDDAPTEERAVVIAKAGSEKIEHLATMRSRGDMTPIKYEGYDLASRTDKSAEITMRWRFTGNRGPQVSVSCRYDASSFQVYSTNVCTFADGQWAWEKAEFSLNEPEKEQ